ncbi:expressed unknown protein [Seminavis robusta]|uniref:Uncharacterized protein n=1 Tax=Seminavis robusta TaxID=568900 RepID=A0A9N8EEH4_9STRA|nr:expressed unknown protein [Seminavis robusta]|eukprot:Sro1063_g237030.1 n/a (88) ;mRNA; r:2451-2714
MSSEENNIITLHGEEDLSEKLNTMFTQLFKSQLPNFSHLPEAQQDRVAEELFEKKKEMLDYLIRLADLDEIRDDDIQRMLRVLGMKK